jgi:hypothetical protein
MGLRSDLKKLNKQHIPSYSRGLFRLFKRYRGQHEDQNKIIEIVKEIPEPYYVIFSLANIGVELQKNRQTGFQEVFNDSAEYLEKVTPDWRLVEIFQLLLNKMSKVNNISYSKVLTVYLKIKATDSENKMARAIARAMVKSGSTQLDGFLSVSGTESERANFVKIFAHETIEAGNANLIDLERVIPAFKDPVIAAKLWGYLSYKVQKLDEVDPGRYFRHSIELLDKDVDNDSKGKLLAYLVDIFVGKPGSKAVIEEILEKTTKINDQLVQGRVLVHAAGKIAKKDKEKAIELFGAVYDKLEDVPGSLEKAKLMINLTHGLKRASQPLGDQVNVKVHELAEQLPEEEKRSILSRLELKHESTKTEKKKTEHEKERFDQTKRYTTSTVSKSKHNNALPTPILGLFNTYDQNLAHGHKRAIARAAPLCLAYGLDLGIYNFPINDINHLIKSITQDTSIGEGGKYISALYMANRIELRHKLKPEKDQTLIATTPEPESNKRVNIHELADLLNDGGTFIILLGVGKQGLPQGILNMTQYQLEMTDQNIHLETCTAMGILAYVLNTIFKK